MSLGCINKLSSSTNFILLLGGALHAHSKNGRTSGCENFCKSTMNYPIQVIQSAILQLRLGFAIELSIVYDANGTDNVEPLNNPIWNCYDKASIK